ncbi:hypothetical protein AhnVgp011 [Adoxophyes honmai nucleopolyhedrovirus]|uniref:Nudix hydrolase domain-containing protein n=1 Tax=Adoxophyes honmai nucleopolyhedrovirus TaxID=224399 RepID=Q80LT5_NPVAH|nr:hypothetical protein AhnVgp011 [Adoxophyes honmai nucleopolyhedrovirus]BAC67262.1 hypothetical protein [Adoxophyes honmai nucleopolyhedrovirus]
MRSAGLFLIMEKNRAILLNALKSYKASDRFAMTFAEKISIPRGRRDGNDLFDYETAVREFIEETGTYFESAYVYNYPFYLQWNDDGVVYKYYIYIGILKGILQTLPQSPNTFCVRLKSSSYKSNDYNIYLTIRKQNNELPRNLYISTLNEYYQYMHEKQLVTYRSSNYVQFFEYIEIIKNKFDCCQLKDFFLLRLHFSSPSPIISPCRRKKISSAIKTELRNIITRA